MGVRLGHRLGWYIRVLGGKEHATTRTGMKCSKEHRSALPSFAAHDSIIIAHRYIHTILGIIICHSERLELTLRTVYARLFLFSRLLRGKITAFLAD